MFRYLLGDFLVVVDLQNLTFQVFLEPTVCTTFCISFFEQGDCRFVVAGLDRKYYVFMAEYPSEICFPRSPTAPHRWPTESEERRSRAPEFYGFVAWTSTFLLFVLYILWAVLPDQYIVWFGITWYPNRHVHLFLFFSKTK